MTEGQRETVSNWQLGAEAFILMERAQLLLDRAGLKLASAHLDHALSLIPDDSGAFPRERTNPPIAVYLAFSNVIPRLTAVTSR